jgi:VanZ family protein
VSARRWLPPVMWAAFILVLTSIPSPPGPPAGIPHLDKVVHFVLYAGLGWLVTSALRTRRPTRLAIALTSVAVFAASDEWHQRFFARDPAVLDWVADVIGASAGTLVAVRVRRVETPS